MQAKQFLSLAFLVFSIPRFEPAFALSRLGETRISNGPISTSVSPAEVVPGKSVRISYQNDALLGRPTKIHLGYNGWNLNAPGFSEFFDGGNRDFYKDTTMIFDTSSGTYYVDVQVPPEARAIHYVFCWDACGPNQWDSNGSKDYGWPITFPYVGPFLTWNKSTDATSGVVVSFEDPFALEANLELWSTSASTTRIFLDSSRKMHRFILNNLTPGTTYFYRVKSGSLTSPTYSFRTHDGSRNLKFIAMSDTQNGGEWCAFPFIKKEIMEKHRDVDFLLFAGDFAWNDNPGQWWNMFDSARDLLASKVIMLAPGNHDTPTNNSNSDISSFRYYFDLPYETPRLGHYEFSAGPATFFAMDSENVREVGVGGVEYSWLGQKVTERKFEIEKDPHLWTFAFWHVPPVDAARRHAGQQYAFQPAAILASQVVDFHFSGHEHLYQRSAPLDWQLGKQTEYGVGPERGTGYVVLPSSGAWPEPGLGNSGAERVVFAGSDGAGKTAGNGFVRIDINDNALLLRTFQTMSINSPTGIQLVDQITVQKR